MYYYAYIDENNIVTGVYAMPTEINVDGYISITEDQYTNGDLVGKLYNPETGEFTAVPVWVGSTDDIQYKSTTTTLSSKLDAMDAAIASASAGADGEDGASAYEIAVANGFTGTEAQWLESLHGTNGTDGSDGSDGLSAYELAQQQGFTGSLSEWLASLHGTNGEDGSDGANGTTVVVGNTTTSEAGSNASVTGSLNSETNTLTLNFTIPRGANGTSGSADTPAQVLEKIKTVDGANSGLDADTLDGNQASDFAAANHSHSSYATTEALSSLETTVNGKANATHTHSGYASTEDVEALQTAVNGKASVSHTHSDYASVNHTHSNYASASHNHDTAYAGISHTHSGYASTSDIDSLEEEIAGKANASHSHSEYASSSSVETLQTAVNGKADADHTHTDLVTNTTYANGMSGKADAYHSHSQSEITGLETALNGKADANHAHTQYATLSAVYPVGSIYFSVSNANPNTLFGGVWEAFGTGRVLMGVPSNGSAGATGGSETASIAAHTHTTASHALTENEMPTHHHNLLNYNENGSTTFDYTNSSVMSNIKQGYGGNVMTSYIGGGQAHSHGDTGSAGASTISVVQPYITCYMWKRTS